MPASPEHGGKCRALWGDRGKRVYTGKNHLIPVPFARFLPLPLVGYGVSLTFAASLCSSKSGSLAFTLPHTFFITIFPTVFYDRSRMTGRQLILFCKKPFYLSVHTCPFRQPDGWHLPRQAGTACVFYSILFSTTNEKCFGNAIHSCRHSWAVGRTGMMTGEKHHVTLSEESGKRYT